MQIETLKIFCDLVETRSFSQAAERNFVTQSAVSQQVRGLEAKFKRRLLERVRGRRELHLTQAGEAFYQASREVLEAYANLEEGMRQLAGTVGGTVRVATVYSVGLHELPPVVRQFMALYPKAKIDLEYSRTTRVVRDVVSGAVDIGVVASVYSVGLHELPPVVRQFMALYPKAKIDLEYSRTTRVVRDVVSGAVDIGVVAYPEKRRGL